MGRLHALRSITVNNEKWDSGLTIKGSGSVALGNETDHNRVPLDVTGNLTVSSTGSIKCLAEKTDIASVGGLRYSFSASSTSSTPVRTTLAIKGTLEGNKM